VSTLINIGALVYSSVISGIKLIATDGGKIELEGSADNILNEDGSADVLLLEDFK